jgi:hypothetical protein
VSDRTKSSRRASRSGMRAPAEPSAAVFSSPFLSALYRDRNDSDGTDGGLSRRPSTWVVVHVEPGSEVDESEARLAARQEESAFAALVARAAALQADGDPNPVARACDELAAAYGQISAWPGLCELVRATLGG